MRKIRALYTPQTITVYQAYPPAIARAALAEGRFVPPFKRERMTWIKPSFLWMMYRCGWATKPDQETVLAVEITRAGFEEALSQACLSHYDADRYTSHEAWSGELKKSPVRIQWDPERSLHLGALPYRSLQVGLSGPAVHQYVDNWLVRLADVTPLAREIHNEVLAGNDTTAKALLPPEQEYPLPQAIATHINAT